MTTPTGKDLIDFDDPAAIALAVFTAKSFEPDPLVEEAQKALRYRQHISSRRAARRAGAAHALICPTDDPGQLAKHLGIAPRWRPAFERAFIKSRP